MLCEHFLIILLHIPVAALFDILVSGDDPFGDGHIFFHNGQPQDGKVLVLVMLDEGVHLFQKLRGCFLLGRPHRDPDAKESQQALDQGGHDLIQGSHLPTG